MKFDLLLWVINVLNLKFEWTALSSEHWGNHFSIIKNKTNHHPLFLSSPSFGIPMFSPALQNLKHHLQTHWNCWEPFSMSPWKFPAVYGKDVHPLGLTTVSLHTCAPGLHWGMASHLPWLLTLFVRLFVCSRIRFQHTHWWKEYSAPSGFLFFTNLPPDVKYLHFTVWRQSKRYPPRSPSSARNLMALWNIYNKSSAYSNACVPWLCPFRAISLQGSQVKLSLSITCLPHGLSTLPNYKILHQRNKGSSPALRYPCQESETKQNCFLGINHPYQRERNI